MNKQDQKLSNGKPTPLSNPQVAALAAVQAALDTADTGNVPANHGVLPLAVEQPEDPAKPFGALVCGVVDPLIEHIDKSVEKWLRMRVALVTRRELLLKAARDNADFALGAKAQLTTVDEFIEKMTTDFEASVPTLPLAKAA